MKCSLNGSNTKRLQKILQSLSRIGTELYIVALLDSLSLCTMNASESVFIKVILSRDFFQEYEQYLQQDTPSSFDNKCHVSLKSILSVFRNIKNIELCTIKLKHDEEKLTMRMRRNEDMVRILNIPLLERVTPDVPYLREHAKHHLICVGGLYTNLLANFHAEPELTIDFTTAGNVVVKNYIDDRIVDKSEMRTRVRLHQEEFQEYQVTGGTRLSFCLKSFRAFISMIEALNLQSGIRTDFAEEGSPVFFSVNENPITVTLLMATLAIEDYEHSMMSFDENVNSVIHASNQPKKRQKSPPAESASESPPVQAKKSKPDEEQQLMSDTAVANADTVVDSCLYPNPPPAEEKIPESLSSSDIVFVRGSSDSNNPPKEDSFFAAIGNQGEGEEESIPPSPPTQEEIKRARAKARRVFKRCFEPTFHLSQMPGRSEILAPNSDSE